jgi:trimeric autotransporter adhesin
MELPGSTRRSTVPEPTLPKRQEYRLKPAFRRILVSICLVPMSVVLYVCLAVAQEVPVSAPGSFEITGVVKSGKIALPGVTVTAANTLTGNKVSVATRIDGSFVLKGLWQGRYRVKMELMGFTSQVSEVVLNPQNPTGKVEAQLLLASRQQDEKNNRESKAATASRGFLNLALEQSLSIPGGAGAGSGTASGGDLSSLPLNGSGAEISSESVSIAGAQGRTQDFGMGSEEEIQQRIQEFRERAQREGGGPGGRIGRGFNINQPHGFLSIYDDNALLDARSYSLTGRESGKASYNQLRFAAFVGGPLRIPGLFDRSKSTFYSAGWNGTRGSAPYDAYSTVPTVPERNGVFSGLTDNSGNPIVIWNPQTGQPFPGNTIDLSRFSPSAVSLLHYVPFANLPGATQNFHYIASSQTDTDTASLRLVHNFGASSGPGPITSGGGPGAGRKGTQNNLSLGFNWSRTDNAIVNPFPSLAGAINTQGWNGRIRWTYGKGRVNNTLGFTYNHNRVSRTNLYSGLVDVAGNAGITGVSGDPFDWGLPGTSFSNFAGFSGPVPSRQLDQTFALSDTVIWNHAKHNWRFGGDYRWIVQSFRSARNGEGSFVFTGFATAEYLPGSTQVVPGTGYDLADFLLGLPQQTSLQSGTNPYDFHANAFDLFVQDNWRILAKLTLLLGLRYEYNGPFTETSNHIANLDVSPGYTNAVPVFPGRTGPYSGFFPYSLVRPDWNGFAPRIGLAWRVGKQTVVRAGYAINYNLGQYATFVRNFAFQPPFAETSTNVSTLPNTLTLEDGFPTNATTVSNNFAVNPNYKLAYVQIWNLDIQRNLPWNVQLNVGYNGSKGTDLDTQRALVAGGQPFVYDSSEGNSILHFGSVRVRKRMSKGLGISASYVFAKSIDNASSIGGGTVVVAQNPYDISADRGLSSFNQQHKFTGNWIYDLPFGDGKRFITTGRMSHVLGGWQWSGDFTLASGFYFTPRVLGASLDINRGVSGSLRANLIPGHAISVSNPTTAEWFNTTAFCAPGPTCPGTTGGIYGDAGRNIILGPPQYTFNMAINKTITFPESRALDLRFQANNIFNTPYFSHINTVVNSLNFGHVTGVGNMRRVTMVARFRF